jgi:very-short-patch-repair endonuclease
VSQPAAWLVDVKAVDVELYRLAARQYSLAQYRQVIELGMTPRQLRDRVEVGLLVPVHRGVYRLGGGPASAEQGALAAVLAAGSGAVASHRSAAALWGLRGVEAGAPEITVVGTACPTLRGVVVHRTDRLDPVDVSRACRVPVTSPARTLLDLGAVAPAQVVESALEDALMRRLVTFALLTATLRRLGRRGRRGTAVLRVLVQERDPATAPTESVLEDTLLQVLRRGGLPAPVRQHDVGGVRLDFAYPRVRLGIEADSRIWHGGRLDVQRNSRKANLLLAHGWRVLHFTSADLRMGAAEVIDTVERELAVACLA